MTIGNANRIKNVGLIGFGAIGEAIARLWQRSDLNSYRLVSACVRPKQAVAASAVLGAHADVTFDIETLAKRNLDIVIEAAGHDAIVQSGAEILNSGCDLMILSVGALASEDLFLSLKEAASTGNSRIIIPSGALAGFDGIRSLHQGSELRSVTYTSTKPPLAWVGTLAEATCDLTTLTERRVLFQGTARRAAQLYPKNANLAATVALAGVGFDATRVELIADPESRTNRGSICAIGSSGELHLTLEGKPSAENPKTSEITSRSVLSALLNASQRYCFL